MDIALLHVDDFRSYVFLDMRYRCRSYICIIMVSSFKGVEDRRPPCKLYISLYIPIILQEFPFSFPLSLDNPYIITAAGVGETALSATFCRCASVQVGFAMRMH